MSYLETQSLFSLKMNVSKAVFQRVQWLLILQLEQQKQELTSFIGCFSKEVNLGNSQLFHKLVFKRIKILETNKYFTSYISEPSVSGAALYNKWSSMGIFYIWTFSYPLTTNVTAWILSFVPNELCLIFILPTNQGDRPEFTSCYLSSKKVWSFLQKSLRLLLIIFTLTYIW